VSGCGKKTALSVDAHTRTLSASKNADSSSRDHLLYSRRGRGGARSAAAARRRERWGDTVFIAGPTEGCAQEDAVCSAGSIHRHDVHAAGRHNRHREAHATRRSCRCTFWSPRRFAKSGQQRFVSARVCVFALVTPWRTGRSWKHKTEFGCHGPFPHASPCPCAAKIASCALFHACVTRALAWLQPQAPGRVAFVRSN